MVDLEEGQEPEELLPANVLANLVMCNKAKTIALDVFSDRFSIVVYEYRTVGKNNVKKWVKAPGPYQASIAKALNKVRELMRLQNLSDVKTLDKLIEHEKSVTAEVFETFDEGFKQLKTRVFSSTAQTKELSESQKPEETCNTTEKPAVSILSSEELLAAKKASALSVGPKKRGRPPKQK